MPIIDLYKETVSKKAIDVSPAGQLVVLATADALAAILAADYDCNLEIRIVATCPDEDLSGITYQDRVQINYGCKGQAS